MGDTANLPTLVAYDESQADASLQIPYDITFGSNTVNNQFAPTVINLAAATNTYAAVLTQSDQGFTNGLVARPATSGSGWKYVLPYQDVMSFLVNGGNLHIYLDPTAEVTGIPSTAFVYKNGVAVNPTPSTIPAGTGTWAVLELNHIYMLPPATSSELGGVKVGTNLTVGGDGTLAVPEASNSVAGVVKVGANLTIASGVLSGPAPYTLPEATNTVLGGVKVGTGIKVNAGEISVDDQAVINSLPKASDSTFGIVKVGANLTVNAGVLEGPAPYALPEATTSVLGGVKIGSGINVASGTISVDSQSIINALPKATDTTFGIVETGTGIANSGGKISVAPASTSQIGGIIIGDGLELDAAGKLVAKNRTLFRQQNWSDAVGAATEPNSQTIYDYTIPANTLKPNSRLEFKFLLNDPYDAANSNPDGSYKYATKERGARLTIGDQLIINDVRYTAGLSGYNIWSIGTTDPDYNAQSWAPSTFFKVEVHGKIWLDSTGKARMRLDCTTFGTYMSVGNVIYQVFDLNVDFTKDQKFTLVADFKAKDDKIFFGDCEINLFSN
jgi:hypothetical protein